MIALESLTGSSRLNGSSSKPSYVSFTSTIKILVLKILLLMLIIGEVDANANVAPHCLPHIVKWPLVRESNLSYIV
jgi:hypothetical protein